MNNLVCKIEHLKLSEGDIVTVSGLALDEFHRTMGTIHQAWRRQEINEGVLFLLLPESGALSIETWEFLQEWQKERLKDG